MSCHNLVSRKLGFVSVGVEFTRTSVHFAAVNQLQTSVTVR